MIESPLSISDNSHEKTPNFEAGHAKNHRANLGQAVSSAKPAQKSKNQYANQTRLERARENETKNQPEYIYN